MRKRQLRDAAAEFEKKKASAEYVAKQRAAELARTQAASKAKLDASYKTLEELSGKKYLPLGSVKRAAGFDNAYDDYINKMGQYISLFPSPVMDTSGVNPNAAYTNLPIGQMPTAAKPWPTPVRISPPKAEESSIESSTEGDDMEKQIADLMKSEKLTREEAVYVLTGK